jgi:peptide/nickel transport system substrate-binding protein
VLLPAIRIIATIAREDAPVPTIDRRSSRVAAAALVFGLALSACDPAPTAPPATGPTSSASAQATAVSNATPTPKTGGTLYVLTQGEQWNHVDPQRVYTAEDLAFFGATTMRALTAFKVSADPIEGTTLVPDMATDLGTPANGGRDWSFTLRPGVTWQDGTDVTCEDIKYGVSRTFATDLINQGPTYAIAYLDIPTEVDGSSAYKGPYDGNGEDLYDKAVECDGRTITFHLNKPIADFNYTVTLGFGAVRQSDDTGETFGVEPAHWVTSNGPYQVDSYSVGQGGKYVLVRNKNWKQESDPIRKAYPDRWEVHFTVDPHVLDRRVMDAEGNDAFALQYGQVQPENLATAFGSPETPTAAFAGRAVSGFDPYTRYYWINVQKVTNVKIRQAMMVALDRAAIRDTFGGEFYASFADGVLKPNIGRDHAATGIWDCFFGQSIPPSGDPDLARTLIRESGESPPTLTFVAADTPTQAKAAQIVINSLGRAGISVVFEPIVPYCGYGFCEPYEDQLRDADFGAYGWGADWPNASTVIPPLFTKQGGWDLSQVDDPTFNSAVADALTMLDRAAQAQAWQALNRTAVELGWVIPTFFSLNQSIAGTRVGPIYRWPAYQAWPYAEMYVTP